MTPQEKYFSKPIMMLLLMFMGQIPAIIIWGIQQLIRRPAEREEIPTKTLYMLIIPALCDLLCTALLLIAQLYITASLWQMMRGSVIVITALLKRLVLKKRLKKCTFSGDLNSGKVNSSCLHRYVGWCGHHFNCHAPCGVYELFR
jgi:drug/metabolite transporter (DMT)-like permease